MASGNSLVLPVVLWGRHAPTHCISSILISPNYKNIVTGCNDGQICIWDVAENWQIYPRSMLFGHTKAISCLALALIKPDRPYIVSSSEDGAMCLWDISDGRCLETTRMSSIHTDITTFHFRGGKDLRLVCNGYYPEIFLLDPLSFEVIHVLCSRVDPNWISACCVLRPTGREDDVVLAISNSGLVKVWTLSGQEIKGKPIQEDESKQVRCLNAQTLTCCPFNQRTVLVVCSKYWQVYNFEQRSGRTTAEGRRIYDASDFTLLCSESNRCGERWMGGSFITTDRVVVWSSDGKGYLYKLPTKNQEKKSAQAESPDYHRQMQPTSPHAYYVLDVFTEKPPACSPAMYFSLSSKEAAESRKILLRGDSEGRVVIWLLPEVSEKQMTLVRQESFDRLPVLSAKTQTTLQEVWDHMYKPPAGILDGICDEAEKPVKITATIYVPSQGKLVCGRVDGTIVLLPACHSIMLQLLCTKTLSPSKLPRQILPGHEGRVTCLLYPFNESTRYDPQHLLSGGADFSVCLWDIDRGVKLHTFTVHGGPLSQLLVPPSNCNQRILSCVCSVATDHSVALLSLKERKCIMLAGRHLFPVATIRWRPLDDFMVVSCTDGTIYVWQMETGHLDRVVQGLTAEEILKNCDENAMPVENLTNPSLTFAQALKRRNLATFRNFAQQKLADQSSARSSGGSSGPRSHMSKPTGFPMLIQGIKTNTCDPEAHVIFFDTEALIVQLLTEDYAMLSPGELEARGLISATPERTTGLPSDLAEAHQKIIGFINKAKEKAESVGQKIQASMDSPVLGRSQTSSPVLRDATDGAARQSRPDSLIMAAENLTLDTAQLFVSLLHAWGLDPDLDRVCLNKLGLVAPQCPVSFGLVSRMGHMSLMLPGWHKRLCQEELTTLRVPKGRQLWRTAKVKTTLVVMTKLKSAHSSSSSLGPVEPEPLDASGKPTLLAQRMGSIPFEDENLDDLLEPEGSNAGGGVRMGGGPRTPKPVHTTDLVVRETAHREETRLFSSKARWQISSAVTTQHLLSVIAVANTLMSMSHSSFLTVKQSRALRRQQKAQQTKGRGLLVARDLGEGGDSSSEDEGGEAAALRQSQIKQGWSLLAALHCVLLPELVGAQHYCPPLLEMLARRWQDRCLEIREAAQALLLGELRRLGTEGRKAVVDDWAPYLPMHVEPNLSILSDSPLRPDENQEDDEEEDDQMLSGDSSAHRSTSFESRRKQATAIVMLGVIGAEFGAEIEPSRRRKEEEKKSKKNQEGFSLTNYNLSRHTSKALTYLLLTPATPRLPSHIPVRRAAIDLLGRGFTVWEPYLDVSAVLLGLLELCVDADRLVPSMTYGLPLSPEADSCRTARHALSLIATARPPAFIITMAKEVARYNAMAQNAQSQHASLQASVLLRARNEILHVIELLTEKMPNDVADLLVEAMDVTVFCLEPSQLKSKGLQELFPAICRFSMVSYCAQTKRIWVGSKNGSLAVYENKQHSKCQTLQAHQGAIIAVAVSPDGKYLATFSHIDLKLKFWQTASSSIFGLGSQQTKLVRQYACPQVQVTVQTNVLKLVRLIWIESRTVVLLAVDGSETKYSV